MHFSSSADRVATISRLETTEIYVFSKWFFYVNAQLEKHYTQLSILKCFFTAIKSFVRFNLTTVKNSHLKQVNTITVGFLGFLNKFSIIRLFYIAK